jgi:hypothetical protein
MRTPQAIDLAGRKLCKFFNSRDLRASEQAAATQLEVHDVAAADPAARHPSLAIETGLDTLPAEQ